MNSLLKEVALLSHNDLALLFLITLLLPTSSAYLSIFGLPRKKLLFSETHHADLGHQTLNNQQAFACHISKLVLRVSGRLPWTSTCLARSLTAQMVLFLHRIPTTLTIGVIKEGQILQAHAWLSLYGLPLDPPDKPYSIIAKLQ